MDWQTFFTVVNTADTVLGLVFLLTSWIVGRSWLRSRHGKEANRDDEGGASG